MKTKADRLRQARNDAGYKTAQAAIDAFGFQGSAYRHHENGTRAFDVEAARRYAKAFKVNAGYLLGLDTVSYVKDPAQAEATELLEVVGVVQAGVWRERAEWPKSERYQIKVGPNPVPGSERFALRLEGRSMDLTIPPGSELECIRVAFSDIAPIDGDLVIVERANHDLTETTCKRLRREGDDWVLYAESTDPEFSTPIRLGRPDLNDHTDNSIRVIGIVIRTTQNHFRKH